METMLQYIKRELKKVNPNQVITVTMLLNIIKQAEHAYEKDEDDMEKRIGFPHDFM